MARSKQAATAADTVHNADTASTAITRNAGVSQLRQSKGSPSTDNEKLNSATVVQGETHENTGPDWLDSYVKCAVNVLSLPEYWKLLLSSNEGRQMVIDQLSERTFTLPHLFPYPKLTTDALQANVSIFIRASKLMEDNSRKIGEAIVASLDADDSKRLLLDILCRPGACLKLA
ncbi:MAG: hypothetical protein WCP12_14660 [bacterium]